MPGTYRCDCQPGFRGPYCSEDIDECILKPCRNGGRCQNDYGAFKCNCPQEYYGVLCEKACRPGTCLNDGICHEFDLEDEQQGWKCQCPQHIYGEKCQHISPCYYVPCGAKNECMDDVDDILRYDDAY